ncbi:hypothetical protein AAL_01261 [Moelleriella libera RCEF 2490]|uniref:Uncharacterized protein n=1 Tax=Moelleriella libera RCEF 2490 TaxID=1081109 RepID=A0A166VLM5_9HYPO|nr:hypothetical protein AAL_01261 [Moelleriella libera RCEF 2490]
MTTSLSETPPDHSGLLPLTPPDSERRTTSDVTVESVQDLRRYWERVRPKLNKETAYIKISDQFDPLQHTEEISGFIRRFDCYSTFIRVRMPTTIHDAFCRGLEDEYRTQKLQYERDFVDIRLAGSSDVSLSGRKQSRSPDIQFRHLLHAKPRVIIEVAYSQSLKELRDVAEDYILETDGQVRRVYGIKLSPLGGKPLTISEWRPKITPSDNPDFDEDIRAEEIYCKEFRSADGSPVNPHECIVISAHDFDVAAEAEISIPFRRIFEILQEVEQMQNVPEERPAKRLRHVRRTPSPIEQLNEDDEAVFAAREDAEEEAGSGKDPDYEPGSNNSQESASSL